jgi:hypothetical protein
MFRETSPFLYGLSSFWSRLFGDQDLLNKYYQGSEKIIAQAYFDLMESVLGSSLREVPLYHRDHWKLITISADQSIYNTVTGNFEVQLSEEVVSLNLLCSSILAPLVSYEVGREYDLITQVGSSGANTTSRVAFYDDPFSSGTGGRPIDGLARSVVVKDPVVHAKGVNSGNLSAATFIATHITGSNAGNPAYSFTTADKNRYVVIVRATGEEYYTIDPSVTTLSATPTYNVSLLDSDGNPPAFTIAPAIDSGVTWRVESQGQLDQIAFWAPDVSIDEGTLRKNFGYLVNRFEVSTESYRQLVLGIFQYFLLGPALRHVEAALNVVTEVPVAQSDGEQLLTFNAAYSATHDRILTNVAEYFIPVNSARADIAAFVPNYSEPIEFNAFEPFTTIFTVHDSKTSPTWWNNIVIPKNLMPYEEYTRRVVTPQMTELVYSGSSLDRYGDLGVFYNADDYGNLVPSAVSTRPPLHHRHAYHAMNGFFKHHTFGVFVDAQFKLPRAQTDLVDIIEEGKPSHTYMYFQAGADFVDKVLCSAWVTDIDISLWGAGAPPADSMQRIDNLLTVGSTTQIGDTYTYTATSLTTQNYPPGAPFSFPVIGNAGETPVTIGGEDPATILSGLNDELSDWPVSLDIGTIP